MFIQSCAESPSTACSTNITADLQSSFLPFYPWIIWIQLFCLMLVPLCCCTLINVHFDVFFNVCGIFWFVSFGAGRTVSSRQYSPFWHQRINKGCNKSKNKKITLSTSPILSLAHQKHCNVIGTSITFMSGKTSIYEEKRKASNTIKGNFTILTTSQECAFPWHAFYIF